MSDSICAFFSSRAQDRQVWIPEHTKVGGVQFLSVATGDFNFDHLVKPLSNIHMTAKIAVLQFVGHIEMYVSFLTRSFSEADLGISTWKASFQCATTSGQKTYRWGLRSYDRSVT